ncbi:hypothetical protein GCM10010320_72300 [Streptomyces caelestis]|nr:hypothetical protein GCM10010320_72300 [Streptomyces caelestis]
MAGGAESVDGEAAQGGHVLRAVSGTNLGGIITEGGVTDEVEPVFDHPVRLKIFTIRSGDAWRLVRPVITETVSRLRLPFLVSVRWRTTLVTWAACGKSTPRSVTVRA